MGSWIWTKSEIKCPKKGMFYAVKTRINEIHLFEMNKAYRWKIKLSDIISIKRGTKSQQEIDSNIMSSLRGCLVQEKKTSRALSRKNQQLTMEKMENEKKMKELKASNTLIMKQNEKLMDELKTLQTAYDELNKQFIENGNKAL